MTDVSPTPVPDEFSGNPDLASPAQLEFVRSLASERDIPADASAAILARVDSGEVTKRRATEWINRLKDKPLKPGVQPRKIRVEYEDMILDGGKEKRVGRVIVPDVGGVLAGHYALDTDDLAQFTNDVSFFQVWVGTRGGWKVFMEVSDDSYELDNWGTKREIIARIARDPRAASARWGLEFSRCGVCGRRLTNDESRALGIGPICRTRL